MKLSCMKLPRMFTHSLRPYSAIAVSLALIPVLAKADAPPTVPPPVTTPPVAVAEPPALAVVRQFLTDRTETHLPEAYALLSSQERQGLPLAQFATGIPPSALQHAEEDGVTPLLTALGVFFMDTHNASGYTFQVVGPDPADGSTVLVRATPPDAASQDTARPKAALPQPFLLKIVTSLDTVDHAQRLQLLLSYQRTSPEGFLRARDKARQASSLSNLKQIALGIYYYVQDHNETLPDADKWVDEILPYVKNAAIFHDPSAPASEKWSYAYNSALSHVSLAKMDMIASTVMVFESGKGVKNASDAGSSVPHPGRHLGGGDYALADGHAEWHQDGTLLSYKLSEK